MGGLRPPIKKSLHQYHYQKPCVEVQAFCGHKEGFA